MTHHSCIRQCIDSNHISRFQHHRFIPYRVHSARSHRSHNTIQWVSGDFFFLNFVYNFRFAWKSYASVRIPILVMMVIDSRVLNLNIIRGIIQRHTLPHARPMMSMRQWPCIFNVQQKDYIYKNSILQFQTHHKCLHFIRIPRETIDSTQSNCGVSVHTLFTH